MFRGMIRTLLVAVLGVVSVAKAEITWVPESSTWNTTNNFVAITYPGVPEGTGGATLSGPYGVGINNSNMFTLGFIKSTAGMVPGVIPTVEQSDLSGTVLGAGTVLNLVFTKGESDRINYIAIVGDGSQTVNYKVLSATSFSVQVSITSAVQSASGAAGVQFGMLIDYQANAQLDFKGTVFMTDIHYQDIAAPDSIPTGLA
ncbi:MAG: hypothetical protein GYA55_13085, partial [SAR324 cluster bacterium]|nr:hypothetical protein [SAR324 cluster bacterium]